jgi:hypothetical protein
VWTALLPAGDDHGRTRHLSDRLAGRICVSLSCLGPILPRSARANATHRLSLRHAKSNTSLQGWRDSGGGEGGARLPTAGLWPAGDSRPRSRRGPGVKPFTPDPSGPSRSDAHVTVTISLIIDVHRSRTDWDAQRAGRWGAAPHNGRLPLPDATTTRSTLSPLCRAPAARRARGAKRERALAGASGGASGPCRPGLKPYRKSSPTGRHDEMTQMTEPCAVPADA